jgi:hypothetical protein
MVRTDKFNLPWSLFRPWLKSLFYFHTSHCHAVGKLPHTWVQCSVLFWLILVYGIRIMVLPLWSAFNLFKELPTRSLSFFLSFCGDSVCAWSGSSEMCSRKIAALHSRSRRPPFITGSPCGVRVCLVEAPPRPTNLRAQPIFWRANRPPADCPRFG